MQRVQRVGLGPAVRAVRAVKVSSGWNPAVGGPQGEGLVTRVPRGAYIPPLLFLIFFSVCRLADNLWVSVLSPCAFWGSSLGVRRRQQALLIELSQEPHYFFKVFFSFVLS